AAAAGGGDGAEARRLRDQADDLRQRARELRRQAERERRDATEAPGPDRPRAELAEARRHQEEVEKTLTDLLTRMEPWSSAREVKGEAGRILQEQRGLRAAVDDRRPHLPPTTPAPLT